ncbi:MAG: hypothetical protein F9K32_17815, partial [Desulfobulbaceae bacterium]
MAQTQGLAMKGCPWPRLRRGVLLHCCMLLTLLSGWSQAAELSQRQAAVGAFWRTAMTAGV